MSTTTQTAPKATQDNPHAKLSDELAALANDLIEFAVSSDISLAALAKEYKISHSALITSASQRALSEQEAAACLPLFRAACNLISNGTEDDDADPLYETLSTAKAVRAQFTRLKMSRTSAKLVIVEGNTGMGKTSAGKIIAAKALALDPVARIFHVEASAGWADRPNAMLSAMLKALGSPDTSRSQAGRLDKLTDALNQRPVVLILDEVHDVGVRCLRVIKTLLNQTTVKLVMLTHPRLFRDLERENWDDVGQLTGNRLVSRVSLGNVQEADVAIILGHRLPQIAAEDRARIVADMTRACAGNGNFAFVREVIIRLRKQATKRQDGFSLKAADDAIRAELKARKAGSL